MVDAAIAVREQLQLRTSVDLAEIAAVSVTGLAATVDEEFRGAARKSRAAQIVEARFALPHLIAMMIFHGRVGITEVADIHDDQVLDLAARIDDVATGQEISGITIWLSEGCGATAKVGPPLGSPENRLSAEQLAIKFAERARHAGRPRRMTKFLRRSR